MRTLHLFCAAAFAGLALAGMTSAIAQTSPAPQVPAAQAPAAAPETKGTGGHLGGGGGGGALGACRADIEKLCSGVAAGRGTRVQCLVDNRDKASPDCQAAIKSVDARRQGAANAENGRQPSGKIRPGKALSACQGDVATLCSGALDKPVKCLKQNAAKVSPECGSALQAMAAAADKLKASCQADVTALCGADAKGGSALKCLRANEAKLSPACGAVVAELPKRVKKAAAR